MTRKSLFIHSEQATVTELHIESPLETGTLEMQTNTNILQYLNKNIAYSFQLSIYPVHIDTHRLNICI